MDPNDTDAFARWIEDQLNNMPNPGAYVVSLPGVWELLTEHFNNAWIDHCNDEEE